MLLRRRAVGPLNENVFGAQKKKRRDVYGTLLLLLSVCVLRVAGAAASIYTHENGDELFSRIECEE